VCCVGINPGDQGSSADLGAAGSSDRDSTLGLARNGRRVDFFSALSRHCLEDGRLLLRIEVETAKTVDYSSLPRSEAVSEENQIESSELVGWKQIAGYLGVSEPTARRYYREERLPVIDRGGRFFAQTASLDLWRRSSPRAGERQPEVTEATEADGVVEVEPAKRPSETKTDRRRYGLAALLAGLLAVTALWDDARPKEIAQLQLKSGAVIAFSDRDKELWRFQIPENHVVSRAIPPMLKNVDGQGPSEVLFGLEHEHQEREAGRLVCLCADGEVCWEFRYDFDLSVRGRYFDSFFTAHHFKWLGDSSTGPFILLVTRHSTWFPSRSVLLEPSTGSLISEYLHPGFIEVIELVDLDGDGHRELMLGGINNPGEGPGHASLAVLDLPLGPPKQDAPNYFGPENARERRYLLFPRADFFDSAELLLVSGIHSQGDRLLVEVGARRKVIHFYLDRQLNLLEAKVADHARRVHEHLFVEGLLDHSFAPEEERSLQRVLEMPSAPDGNSKEVREALAPSSH